MSGQQSAVVVIGGGPGGYEAALPAAQLGARVTVVEREGLGGAAVLTDCVPSKALIATADFMDRFSAAARIGVGFDGHDGDQGVQAHLAQVNDRIMRLAQAQSADIRDRLLAAGVEVIKGAGRIASPGVVEVATDITHVESGEEPAPSDEERSRHTRSLTADVILVATGARPRVLDSAVPDGERILTWQQIYDLKELPEKLIVIGSGVTGAELAHAYLGLGCAVTLVSSRERVLPGEDADAATVLEEVFRSRGMEVLNRSRAGGVVRDGDEVVVTLEDGREVRGSHALLAVGSIPNTADMGLEEAGVTLSDSGHIEVDRVSRTSVQGIYAAGDCTGVLPLASVAAMQGRIAIAHALGDAVAPLNLGRVSSNIFTDPEIATVGVSQADVDSGRVDARSVMLPLTGNPRAKMQNTKHGFVKLFARNGSDTILGGVVVAPRASELIFPITLAVANRLNVDQFSSTFTVYPSMSGSIAEAARQLHSVD
ncbi:NAD(P)H-quinone dehydrogenase [Ornithinimicrobium cryptoxanthini]|uniref:NAD(P)H-quinone dehydrogenase n=1 Tax=Ornithinimicrobium cryptoxanthini TaxID=2934161 RepID=A0ABY4YKJ0_9MICO|nr:NAD(P)H-quinone dehydrogenase [Ornithinimicrobium cryptoxanthini]USQ77236.1 NAD(P)H-quinone dehydrogenase [Ornithinimicrobium cryptoxanthini]